MASGKGGAKTTTTSGPDQASQQYINQILRPLGRSGVSTAMGGESMFPGATPEFLAGLQALGQPINLGFGTAGAGGPMAYSGYTPEQIQASTQMATPTPIGPFQGGVSQMDLGRIQDFFDPYEQSVVSGVQGDYDRQRQMAMQTAAQQATQAGAFGGSRSGVFQAQAVGDVNQQEAARLAQIRSAGYGQALGAAQNEWGTMQNLGLQAGIAQQQGDMFNSSQSLQAALANQGQDFQRQLANQQAGLSAAGLNLQGRGQDLQGSIAEAQMNFQRAQAQIQAAEMQRQIQQQQAQEPLWRQQMAMNFGLSGLGPTGTTQIQQGGGTNWGGVAAGLLPILGGMVGGPAGAAAGSAAGSYMMNRQPRQGFQAPSWNGR
jgi:hypothetical protein